MCAVATAWHGRMDVAREFDVKVVVARRETITRNPAFKAAAARRRCLVPADGYYEWENTDQGKVPYFLHRDDALLAFAGLCELWPDPDQDEDDPDRWLWSYTILTHPAPDALGHVHDRSPVLVPPGELPDDWLNPELTHPDRMRELLAAMPEPVRPAPSSCCCASPGGPARRLPCWTQRRDQDVPRKRGCALRLLYHPARWRSASRARRSAGLRHLAPRQRVLGCSARARWSS